jgi:hypothetical protein
MYTLTLHEKLSFKNVVNKTITHTTTQQNDNVNLTAYHCTLHNIVSMNHIPAPLNTIIEYQQLT